MTSSNLRDPGSENLCGCVSGGGGSIPQLSVLILTKTMERPVRFENQGVGITGGDLRDSGRENLCGCVSVGSGPVPQLSVVIISESMEGPV